MQVHTEFCIGYADFLNFAVGLFAKKTSSSRTNSHNVHNVEFVNTFKTFKSKSTRQGVISDELETIKEDCRSKISYFSER
jgi:hypothetical protein